MFTTSRYSPAKARKLARELASIFNSIYIARGKKTMDELAEFCRRNGEQRICLVKQDDSHALMEFAEIDELGNWQWLEEKVLINEE